MKNELKVPCCHFFSLLLLTFMFSACVKDAAFPGQGIKETPEFKGQPAIDPFDGIDNDQVEAVLNGLTMEEKIGQLIIYTPDLTNLDNQLMAVDYIKKGRVGGLLPQEMEVADYVYWIDSLKRTSAIPLLLGTREQVSLHGQFSGLPKFPNSTTIASLDSAELRAYLENEYFEQCRTLGINFSFRSELPAPVDTPEPDTHDEFQKEELREERLDALKANNMLAFASNFTSDYLLTDDSLRISRLYDVYDFISNGLPGVFLQDDVFEKEQVKSASPRFIQQYLSRKMGFRGLSMARLIEGESPELKLLQGTDLFLTNDVANFYQLAFRLLDEGRLLENDINDCVRQILRAKAWVHGGKLPVQLSVMPRDSERMAVKLVSFTAEDAPKVIRKYQPKAEDFDKYADQIVTYFNAPVWEYFTKSLYYQSVTCASDVNKLLPFGQLLQKDFRIIETAGSRFNEFKEYFSKYADYQPEVLSLTQDGRKPAVAGRHSSKEEVAVILLDTFALNKEKDQAFINSLNELSREISVVLVNFGDPKNLAFFERSITFLQVYERNDWTESYTAQSLFGGVGIKGRLPVKVSDDLPMGASEYIRQERVSFTGPESVGIAPERLVGIDAIALAAIKNKAFPGCQVAVVKNGQVIYSKAFGYHTYAAERPVNTTDLYDIASVSKIAATTLAVMKLVEQNEISIAGKVGEYARLDQNARIRNIKLKDLLIHSSGLQAQMPIAKFYNYRSVPSGGCNDIYCRSKNADFSVQIGSSLFFRADYKDTIWHRVGRLGVSSRKRYMYSDVNFYLLQKVVEDMSQNTLSDYVQDNFYNPLGLRHLMYNPSEKFDITHIVPTERDQMWRKGLVHGFVHDPSAALMGGVGGNAGIFANAEDMAVLFQVLANKGEYGGVRFFEPTTIKDFTVAKYGNHRGLGFDMPTSRRHPTYSPKASSATYGHNGFTGTCVWVDPENELVYVFLSNRIHPSANNMKIFVENVRGRIHDVVYDAFDSFDTELPKLGNN